jgi:hypothetical protein
MMKGRQALLFTSDIEFESVVRQALLGTDTVFLVARTVSDAFTNCLSTRARTGSGYHDFW